MCRITYLWILYSQWISEHSSTNNSTNITLSTTNPDPCILNNVSVSPINDVGIGSSIKNNISFYYRTA